MRQEEREILKEQFEIRQAVYGLQKQCYDVEGGWRKVRPTIWYPLEFVDGSVIWMNSESSLRFLEKFSLDKREVYWDGEAYFQVTKDSNRPFLRTYKKL